MFSDIPLFNEDIQLDPSLLKIDSNRKYNMVLNIYRKSTDFSQAFKKGVRYILFFSKTFENLEIHAFRSMVHKYRGLFRYLPFKSDTDKKYMLLLYAELLKISCSMTKEEFFKEILKKNELNDYWLFFVYFGRLFAADEDYINLKVVIDNAKVGLKKNFENVKELVELENIIPVCMEFPLTKCESLDGMCVPLFRELVEFSYEEVYASKFNNLDGEVTKISRIEYSNTIDSKVDKDDNLFILDQDSEGSMSGENNILDAKKAGEKNSSIDTIILSETDECDNPENNDEEIVYNNRSENSSISSEDGQRNLDINLDLKNFYNQNDTYKSCELSLFETLPPLKFNLFNEPELEGELPLPEVLSISPKKDLKRTREEDTFEEKKLDESKQYSLFEKNHICCTQDVFTAEVNNVKNPISDDYLDYIPSVKKPNISNDLGLSEDFSMLVKNGGENELEPRIDSHNKTNEYVLINDEEECVNDLAPENSLTYGEERSDEQQGNSNDSVYNGGYFSGGSYPNFLGLNDNSQLNDSFTSCDNLSSTQKTSDETVENSIHEFMDS